MLTETVYIGNTFFKILFFQPGLTKTKVNKALTGNKKTKNSLLKIVAIIPDMEAIDIYEYLW